MAGQVSESVGNSVYPRSSFYRVRGYDINDIHGTEVKQWLCETADSKAHVTSASCRFSLSFLFLSLFQQPDILEYFIIYFFHILSTMGLQFSPVCKRVVRS
jgi:hypothetical protein